MRAKQSRAMVLAAEACLQSGASLAAILGIRVASIQCHRRRMAQVTRDRMDNYRLILFVALALVLTLLWQAWEADQRAQQPSAPVVRSGAPAAEVPSASVPSAPDAGVPATGPTSTSIERGEQVTVVTNLVRAEIDTSGGNLHKLWLLEHPVSVDRPNEPFQLFFQQDREVFVPQSGLIGIDGEYPTHKVRYNAQTHEYRLGPNSQELRVPLTWVAHNGTRYTKVFIFKRDSYVIGIEYIVENRTPKPWSGYFYGQFERSYVEAGGLFALPTYTGGAVYTPEDKYRKISFDDMQSKPLNVETSSGWVAMLQHYFVSAWLADRTERSQFYSRTLPENRFIIGTKDLKPTVIPAGETGRVLGQLYAGPKEQERLAELAPGLELTVDYGLLTVISAPLFWLLSAIHDWVGNWGWAIVLLTVLIKLLFYPLSAASYKSMAHMKKVQPKLQSLKERYGDDRQKLNQAMMELYKTEKINPLGGCLPIIIQIPVFIALYWVLLESVELRQAPFVLWIRDLSVRDPYFVLPLIMGASMYAQQLLNPQPPDPVQRRIFMIMPVAFTAMFLFFPAGLVLYWVVNNILSILQQWRINTVIGAKNA